MPEQKLATTTPYSPTGHRRHTESRSLKRGGNAPTVLRTGSRPGRASNSTMERSLFEINTAVEVSARVGAHA